MFEAQEYQPFRFVPKSRLKELSRIVNALMDKVTEIEGRKESCIVKIGVTQINIDVQNIKYFESGGNHKITICYSSGETVHYRGTLNEIEPQLKEFGFLRIQTGYLVNYLYVEKIDSRNIIIKDGMQIPISRTRAKEAREQFLKCMRAERC